MDSDTGPDVGVRGRCRASNRVYRGRLSQPGGCGGRAMEQPVRQYALSAGAGSGVQALLATFSGQPWWAGAFWWSWWTDNGVYAPLDLAIGGKLAASVVRNWWASTPVIEKFARRPARQSDSLSGSDVLGRKTK